VTHVIGNEDKERICEILFPEIHVPLYAVKRFSNHTRAFVKIQDGCNHFCAYCTVPFLRGRSRSRSISSIIDEAEDLIANGHKEIVLTGVNVGDFEDNGRTLADLVRAMDQNPGLERLRISSINPNEVSGQLIDALLEGRSTCPLMHLVLQSGSSSVLQRMRRPYDKDLFFRIVEKFRSCNPDFTFTTDLIVGFPGETEHDFEDSLEAIRQVQFSKVHMFPYSRRPGTLAARFTDVVPQEVIKERKNKVLSLSDEVSAAWRNRFVGRTQQVLTEEGAAFGQTIHGIGVYVEAEKIQPNTLLDVQIIQNSPLGLLGALKWVDV
jgi:threonylcarbamoyladenosine tRNA methylthiotransferase MtaB